MVILCKNSKNDVDFMHVNVKMERKKKKLRCKAESSKVKVSSSKVKVSQKKILELSSTRPERHCYDKKRHMVVHDPPSS